MKKYIALFLSLVLAATTLAGCSSTTETAAETTTETTATETTAAEETTATEESATTESSSPSDFTIGFSNCSQDTPFFANMTGYIEDYAGGLGYNVVSINADNDATKQNTDIQDLITAGIDVLICNPVNEEGPTAGIEACERAGIPVITVDKDVASDVACWVGRDNETMGYIVGEALVEALGGADAATGVVLEIQGTAGSTTMMARRDGFNAALAEAPGLTVVQSAYCDFDRSKAIVAAQDLIQAHSSDIVAVYGHNDDMSVGAAQACAEAGLSDILVCGVDGLMEAVLAIDEGTYLCTASNDPVLEATTAVDQAIKILNGEDVSGFIDAGTLLIDASNVDHYADASLDFATMVE